ncbi:hypothetical protein LTR70_007628 [Exophiala xenobiotica]|uniref:C2H2-type domain-containing protein n=1 Tax=Lithohypha guttulata TaxID=1690604 RepID=A0ABR0K3R2_9EURO|nr:hypothetical protein LTR24_007160 [Lithohypha guttulata]KAK5313442.1 hypothetical protein LTR70_007628 [Exophiala xenobiotica]
MSNVTSVPAYNTFAWDNNNTRQQGNHQLDYPGQSHYEASTNGTVIPQPVQRVDSFNTSDYSHDTLPTLSTDTSFDFDHPTPVESGEEITFRTPEIEDLLWQENYHENPASELMHDSASYHRVPADSMDGGLHSAGLASHKASLPSPQSTNVSTPEASGGHSKKPSQNSTLFTSPASRPNQPKRPLDLDVEMSQPGSGSQYLHTPMQPSSQAASPIIQISRHTRGDSPARSSDFGGSRITKKRSASNLSQGEYFPNVDDEQQSAHLMPPSHDILEEWEEEEQQRTGVAPTRRDAQEIQSFEDIKRQQELDSTVTEVEHWLETTTLDPSSARLSRDQLRPDRIRSRSTGARPAPGQQPILKSNPHPGPGLEVDEASDYYYSSDQESEQSLLPEDHPETLPAVQPPRWDSEVAPEEQADKSEPLPQQFFRRQPWQDPFPVCLPDNSTRYQPDTSNFAMQKFAQRAKEFETASRAATWGTGRRRLSDGDQDSITGDNKTRHLSLTKTRVRQRGISFVHKAKEQYLKRSNSRSKQSQMLGDELEKVQSPEPIEERSSTESQHLTRSNSHSKPKSPSITAALKEATSNLAAVGAGSSGLNLETQQQHEGFIKRTIRRVRSKSDVNKSPKSPIGVASMMAQLGGPPAPIPSPGHGVPSPVSYQATPVSTTHETVTQVRSPIKMPLSPRPANVMPNLEGFRIQVTELNPILAQYLVERIAHDQVRRYKRLKNRVEHLTAATEGKCSSKHLCPTVGGEAEVLPARTGGRDASSSSTFKVAPGADSDNDDSPFDGNVTPAAFPDGIPLPPTKKLPARFECPLCFQVKTFQKPSDWTKHVHEDVQPFTCTFPNCPEPKPFKRKADWVRHENERHRHLEWWKCNISECTHICYRKDNFVQHLVREHKRKEPKFKGRGNSNAKGKGKGAANTFNAEEQEFWGMVDSCRHDSAADARNEPCKFCNNVCTSWKKLSVHVGKHMEQIAMPVLELAERRNVTKDTIISPIEPLQRTPPPYGHGLVTDLTSTAMSPFTQSAASNYQSSSAGHSPAFAPARPRVGSSQGNFLRSSYSPNGIRESVLTSTPYAMGVMDGNSGFAMQVGYGGNQYATYHGQHMMYAQNNHMGRAELIPRTTAPDLNYVNNGTHSPYDDQQYYSSPEQQYVQYQPNMMHMNGVIDQTQVVNGQALQMPVTTESMNNHGYAYVHQQQW